MKMDIRRFPGRGPKCEINMCRNRAVVSIGDEGYKGGMGRTNICKECAQQMLGLLKGFDFDVIEEQEPAVNPFAFEFPEPKPEGGFDLEPEAEAEEPTEPEAEEPEAEEPEAEEPEAEEPEAEEPEAEEPTEPEQVWPDTYADMKREELIPYAKSRGLKVTVTTKTATIIKGLRELDAIS